MERMIYAWQLLEKDRERRVQDIIEFKEDRLHRASIQMWSLRDFCKLVDHKPFQTWLIKDYLKDDSEKTSLLIDAVDSVYRYYMNAKDGCRRDQLVQELKTRYTPVVDARRKNNFKRGKNVDLRDELLRMLEALRYLCQESELVHTKHFGLRHFHDPKYRGSMNRTMRLSNR